MHPNHRDQQLVDQLTAAIPRAQLALQSAQRQHDDIAAILDALAVAVTLLKPPALPHAAERHVTNLEVAAIRCGYDMSQLAFLSSIPEARLRHLAAGAPLTDLERDSLLRILPDWKPSTGGAR